MPGKKARREESRRSEEPLYVGWEHVLRLDALINDVPGYPIVLALDADRVPGGPSIVS
jgi:hypothetical protein